MECRMRIRGWNPQQPQEWRVVLDGHDPVELDREADGYRARLGESNVQIAAILTRKERVNLYRSVRERDQHQCRKCSSTFDVRVVSLRDHEFHNVAKLALLCRVCRHARLMLLAEPFNEAVMRQWLANGRSGLEELVEDFQRKYPAAYANLQEVMGTAGATEFAANAILEIAQMRNPYLKKRLTPKIVERLVNRAKHPALPDDFREDTAYRQ